MTIVISMFKLSFLPNLRTVKPSLLQSLSSASSSSYPHICSLFIMICGSINLPCFLVVSLLFSLFKAFYFKIMHHQVEWFQTQLLFDHPQKGSTMIDYQIHTMTFKYFKAGVEDNSKEDPLMVVALLFWVDNLTFRFWVRPVRSSHRSGLR